MVASISITYICTRALHSFIYFVHYCVDSTVISLLPKATFTLSIQPNLSLPGSHAPFTTAIDTFVTIGTHPFSPNFQTIPTLFYPLNRQFSFNSSCSTNLFVPNSIHSYHSYWTSRTLHFNNIEHSLFFSLHLPYQMSLSNTIMLAQLLHDTNTFHIYTELFIAQHTFQCSQCLTPLIYSGYHISFTSSIHCNLQPQAHETIYSNSQFILAYIRSAFTTLVH